MWVGNEESDGDPNLVDNRVIEIPIVEQMRAHPIPLMKNEMLFEYIATTVEEFLTSRGLADRLIHACLSLPFAINNTAINSGEILFISKSFKFRQRSGTELLRTFQRHLDRKVVEVKCIAIVNDCVSVLEACAVDEVDCAASFTLNAGVNAVYQERISNIRRDETFDEDAKSVLINTELGGFGDGGCLRRFITEFDKRLDRISTAPGLHTFEKFVSGENMGELVRQILKLLTERGQLFGGVWPASLRELRSLPASFLCEIDRDPPHLFYSTEFLLREDLKINNLTPEDIHIVRYVCSAVTYRSACLSAAAAVTILKRLNRLRVTLAVDGYMFRKHPTFYKQMLTMMADLMPKHMTFRIKLPEEGYSVGSGAVAALYKDLVN
ncbi:hexokinase [Echinococcus multilocularis]|uniref:Phosphotransferase n=1 Tax=Echinococcus multilocularis TaxID=6211 RepID=A0A068YCB2_ECHMU|nr:hexokinase [Echinococcus multilocularis]